MKKIAISLLMLGTILFFGKQVKAYSDHSPEIKVFDSKSEHLDLDFQAYDKNFKGGSNAAFAKLDDSGNNFIVTGAGFGGGPQVKVFNKNGKQKIAFFPFSKDFKGGVDVAAGDVNKDGRDEIICSQASAGQAWVKVYNSRGKKVLANFLAFPSGFKGGANIASGDINGDGKDEIIAGAGYGGTPQVRAFNGKGQPIFSSFPFASDFKGGVNVDAGDFDKDNRDEIIASQASEGQAWVKVFKANSQVTILGNFLAYDPNFHGGTSVASIDANNDGKMEVVTAAGYPGGPQVKVFRVSGKFTGKGYFAYDKNYYGGINIAAGKLEQNGKNKIAVPIGTYRGEHGTYPFSNYIEVDISEQWLKYFQDGRRVGYSLASTGVSGRDTPLGIFYVYRKDVAMTMSGPGYYLPDVPYVLSFLGPYTIHGTYWHNNFGHPMSHGCVNLPTPFAKQVFEWAGTGTPVVIHM